LCLFLLVIRGGKGGREGGKEFFWVFILFLSENSVFPADAKTVGIGIPSSWRFCAFWAKQGWTRRRRGQERRRRGRKRRK